MSRVGVGREVTVDERQGGEAVGERRWQAVLSRDGQARDFVYGVATTGVYCRPGCASRLPRRENVRFFATGEEARRAGFRPCKRCRAAQAMDAGLHGDIVAQACERIEEADEPPTLGELAAAAGMSASHFQRVFKRAVGVTPKQYGMERRLGRVRDALRPGVPVTGAVYEAGYASGGRFYEEAAAGLGMRPSDYRDGGRGAAIRYVTARTYLGWALVAATERGICAIELGDGPDDLARRLRARFPAADLKENDPAFADLAARALASLESPRQAAALPLDVQGTAFQRRVWQALRELPGGTTTTYGALAVRIGRPKAARAVAGACAANPAAVAIPCHRVTRGDGGLGGYRWGVERKRALLEREAGPGTDPKMDAD